jgi:hypothetical protein
MWQFTGGGRSVAPGQADIDGMLKAGDKAPDFTLLNQNGEPFTLSRVAEAQGMALDLLLPPRMRTARRRRRHGGGPDRSR